MTQMRMGAMGDKSAPDLVPCWVLQCTVPKRLWGYLNVLPFFVELDLINSILNGI